ncbi:TPA: LOW QUALITY PROTEIN: hypothetical protein N0F65_005692 [Lagenidium giganteum]|uniref:Retrovirus-related Pol polyprotein from transposon TNT 1-94-like beta-barrel domain-containing protein n=1 Tax=Lagenidium giganteum TaxID=4803 RepID=A0AAV2ZAJ4_9STRA|nr:TPA: LOW QUALITY PROTEIN: hypothetical protein N0F65_005692 [Lagenidium giganteum]
MKELANAGVQVSDREMAEVLLMRVTVTHRDVVRHFSHAGAQHNLQDVMNTLQAEREMARKTKMPAFSIETMPRRGRHRNRKERAKPSESEAGAIAATVEGTFDVSAANFDIKHGKAKPMDSKLQQTENDEDESESIGMVAGMVNGSTRLEGSLQWMLDSGSTTHVCAYRDTLQNAQVDDSTFHMWTGEQTRADLVGEVEIECHPRSSPTPSYRLRRVRYVACGTCNLLSVDCLEKDGWQLEFSREQERKLCWARRGGRVLEAEWLLPSDHAHLSSRAEVKLSCGCNGKDPSLNKEEQSLLWRR